MNASLLKGPLTFLTTVFAGTGLGAAVTFLSLKVVLLLGAIAGGVLLLVMPIAAYYAIIASTPIQHPHCRTADRFQVGGGRRHRHDVPARRNRQISLALQFSAP